MTSGFLQLDKLQEIVAQSLDLRLMSTSYGSFLCFTPRDAVEAGGRIANIEQLQTSYNNHSSSRPPYTLALRSQSHQFGNMNNRSSGYQQQHFTKVLPQTRASVSRGIAASESARSPCIRRTARYACFSRDSIRVRDELF